MPVQALQDHSANETPNEFMMDLNDSKLELDQMDTKIVAATLKAFESGSLTPLIKEELRCTIQSRRLAEGKSELKVEFKTPTKKKEMTDEERGRALKRRQQNREAAQRFRQKQKDTSDHLSAKIKRLQSSSNSLINDLKRLREEKQLLVQMLENHLLVCTKPPANHNSNCFHPQNDSIDISYVDNLIQTCSNTTSESEYQSITDCQSIPASTPDTVASDSSSTVFFPDDDAMFVNLQPVLSVDDLLIRDKSIFNPMKTIAQDQQSDICQERQFLDLDVVYEETVVNMDDTDSELDEERRPYPYSSSDKFVCKETSCATDWNSCLSQSMQGITSTYSRKHLDSCSSGVFDPMTDDFFFTEDESP